MEEDLFKYYLPIAKCIFRHTEHTYKAFTLFPYLALWFYKYAPMLYPGTFLWFLVNVKKYKKGTFLVFNHNIYGTYFFSCAAINTNLTAIYVPFPPPSL
jgi:hypothetical protein